MWIDCFSCIFSCTWGLHTHCLEIWKLEKEGRKEFVWMVWICLTIQSALESTTWMSQTKMSIISDTSYHYYLAYMMENPQNPRRQGHKLGLQLKMANSATSGPSGKHKKAFMQPMGELWSDVTCNRATAVSWSLDKNSSLVLCVFIKGNLKKGNL